MQPTGAALTQMKPKYSSLSKSIWAPDIWVMRVKSVAIKRDISNILTESM